MPHIIIKAMKGATEEQMQKAAQDAAEAVSQALSKPKKYISVAFEEYTFAEWEQVYDADIKNKSLLVKPGYSNPKTFQ